VSMHSMETRCRQKLTGMESGISNYIWRRSVPQSLLVELSPAHMNAQTSATGLGQSAAQWHAAADLTPHTHRRNDIGFEPENLALLQDKISASQNMY